MEEKKGYIPIDCNYYDRIEAIIVIGKEAVLEYSDEEGNKVSIQTHIKDTRTETDGEYILLETGEKIRMDRIISLNGVESPGHTYLH